MQRKKYPISSKEYSISIAPSNVNNAIFGKNGYSKLSIGYWIFSYVNDIDRQAGKWQPARMPSGERVKIKNSISTSTSTSTSTCPLTRKKIVTNKLTTINRYTIDGFEVELVFEVEVELFDYH